MHLEFFSSQSKIDFDWLNGQWMDRGGGGASIPKPPQPAQTSSIESLGAAGMVSIWLQESKQ